MRILVVAPNWIGDALMAQPLLVRLKESGATLHVLAPDWVAPVVRRMPEVNEVIYPALPGSRGHELWKRDFAGATSLFGIVLNPVSKARIDAMLDGMRLFGMGWSWGGFESLIIPIYPERARTVSHWKAGGPSLRLYVGLEDPDGLIADLAEGLARLEGQASSPR